MPRRSRRPRSRTTRDGRSFWVTDRFGPIVVTGGVAVDTQILVEADWAANTGSNQLMRLDRIHALLAFNSTFLSAGQSVAGAVAYAMYVEDSESPANDPLLLPFYQDEDILHVGQHAQRGNAGLGVQSYVTNVAWDIKAKRKLSRGDAVQLTLNNSRNDPGDAAMVTTMSGIVRFRITVK